MGHKALSSRGAAKASALFAGMIVAAGLGMAQPAQATAIKINLAAVLPRHVQDYEFF